MVQDNKRHRIRNQEEADEVIKTANMCLHFFGRGTVGFRIRQVYLLLRLGKKQYHHDAVLIKNAIENPSNHEVKLTTTLPKSTPGT